MARHHAWLFIVDLSFYVAFWLALLIAMEHTGLSSWLERQGSYIPNLDLKGSVGGAYEATTAYAYDIICVKGVYRAWERIPTVTVEGTLMNFTHLSLFVCARYTMEKLTLAYTTLNRRLA